MQQFSRLLLLAVLLAGASAHAGSPAMQELADADLGAVAGQQGIAFDLEYRINANADGSANTSDCPDIAGLTDGTSCRLGLNLADHTGIWAVMKNFRAVIKLNNVRIDASNLPSANSPYRNLSKMGGTDPNGKPAIQLTTIGWATARTTAATPPAGYYTFLNQANYPDLHYFLDIERMAAEFDCGTAVNTATGIHLAGCSAATPGWDAATTRVPGYLRNATPGAPISVRMAHGISASTLSPNAPAQIRLDGKVQIYGY